MSAPQQGPDHGDRAAGQVLLAADNLLKIDVAAELRKLAGAQLHASWQLPTELLRLALAGGARRAQVQIRGDQLLIEAPGWRLGGRSLQALALLFGQRDALDDVHKALLALEQDESLGWIALTTQQQLKLDLVIESDDGFYALRSEKGVAHLREHAPPAPRASRLLLRGLNLDQRQALQHLRQSARFASLPIEINGRPPDTTFDDAIDVVALSHGMRGAMAMTRVGQTPRVWLTRHGMVAAHFRAARGPAIELVIEVGHDLSSQATAADLRERGERDLEPAMHQLAARLAWLSEQPRPPRDRRRLCELALACAAAGVDARRLSQLPLLDRRMSDGTLSAWSLLELRAQVEGSPGNHSCFALRPADDARRFDLSTPVVVLDDPLRAALARQLEIDFRPPPSSERAEGLWSRLRRESLQGLSRWLEPLRRSRYASRALSDSQLHASEVAFLQVLRAHLPSAMQVELCAGEFETRASPHALWLARDNPVVRAAINACAQDPNWIYPSLLALGGGFAHTTIPRRQWTARSWVFNSAPAPHAAQSSAES